MKVEFEIGPNLGSSIKSLVRECVSEGIYPGVEIQQAFGIDFSKIALNNSELQQDLVLTVEKKESEE